MAEARVGCTVQLLAVTEAVAQCCACVTSLPVFSREVQRSLSLSDAPCSVSPLQCRFYLPDLHEQQSIR